MTYLDDLTNRRDAISAELAAMSKSRAGGKPNVVNSEGGTDVDHHQYKMDLYEELKFLNERIKEEAQIQAQLNGTGQAFEIDSDGLS